MNVHLLAVIGAYVEPLPFMLNHYRELGIKSFEINVNLRSQDDPILTEVQRYTSNFGCGISNITVGKWSEALNLELYNKSRANRPEDWFIIADLDEFQIYSGDLLGILNECEKNGYDYIEGCFIDRIAADGNFPSFSCDRPIEDQFPLGCVFTYRVLGGFPLKIVAAKGHVAVSIGNHSAMNGVGCPISKCFVQVHHYKWMNGLIDRLQNRANNKDAGEKYTAECKKFVKYFYDNNGRIDISDPELWVSECKSGYKYWDLVRDCVMIYKSPIRAG